MLSKADLQLIDAYKHIYLRSTKCKNVLQSCIPAAMKMYPDIDPSELLMQNCGLTADIVCFALTGSLERKPVIRSSEIKPNRIYNVATYFIGQNSRAMVDHQFVLYTNDTHVQLIHSWVGKFRIRDKIIPLDSLEEHVCNPIFYDLDPKYTRMTDIIITRYTKITGNVGKNLRSLRMQTDLGQYTDNTIESWYKK